MPEVSLSPTKKWIEMEKYQKRNIPLTPVGSRVIEQVLEAWCIHISFFFLFRPKSRSWIHYYPFDTSPNVIIMELLYNNIGALWGLVLCHQFGWSASLMIHI
jgi:hypothetical protein